MGYRSDVRFMIYGPEVEIDKFIVRLKMTDVWGMFENGGSILSEKHVEYMQGTIKVLEYVGDKVKWYPQFDDVIAADRMFELADEMDLCYEFVRIGEDYNDIEVRRSDDNMGYIYVRRHIETDYTEVETKEKSDV